MLNLDRLLRHPRSEIRRTVRASSEAVSFVRKKYFSGFVVCEVPSFDDKGHSFFKKLIAATRIYLEYGSGGSTLLAAKHVDLLVTVDSDRVFLDAVRAAVDRRAIASTFRPIYVDVGFTTTWGNPIFTRPTTGRVRRWSRYPIAPWEYLYQQAVEPDTVLIDGRFRVACALLSFLKLKRASTCNVLVDDYAENSHYNAIEEFGDLIQMHGRMAVFRKRADMDGSTCRKVFEKFCSDFR